MVLLPAHPLLCFWKKVLPGLPRFSTEFPVDQLRSSPWGEIHHALFTLLSSSVWEEMSPRLHVVQQGSAGVGRGY